MNRNAHKTSVVLLIVWGVLHVIGGATIALSPAGESLAMMGSGLDASSLPDSIDAATAGVLRFHGYNLLWMGLLVTFLAATTWRRPDGTRFWIIMVIVGAADVGLIFFMLAPGIMSASDGWIGPVIWLAAAAFGWLGMRPDASTSTQTAS